MRIDVPRKMLPPYGVNADGEPWSLVRCERCGCYWVRCRVPMRDAPRLPESMTEGRFPRCRCGDASPDAEERRLALREFRRFKQMGDR